MLTKKQASALNKEVKEGGDRLVLVFNALSDPGRLKIFRLLALHKGLCVTELAQILKVSVPAASQQLRIMEMSSLVKKERQGQMICYTLAKDTPLVRSLKRIVV